MPETHPSTSLADVTLNIFGEQDLDRNGRHHVNPTLSILPSIFGNDRDEYICPAKSKYMALDNLLNIFKPRDRVFFFHFEASAANVLKMSEDLIAIMKTEPGSQRTALLERLEIAEHANDDLTHTIFTDLARNFITPIDRRTSTSSPPAWMMSRITFSHQRRTWNSSDWSSPMRPAGNWRAW